MPTIAQAFLAACFALQGPQQGPADEAERLLGEIKATWILPVLAPSEVGDPDRVRAHETRLREVLNRRVDLIGRFHRLAPGHRMDRELMMKRWAAMMGRPLADRQDELASEVRAIADEEENPLRVDALQTLAFLALPTARDGDTDPALRAIDAFIKLAPKNPQGPHLLSLLANMPKTPPDRRKSLLARIAAEYPEFKARSSERGASGLAKPFELAFKDAISGAAIDLQGDWKGKVVVVDFWATWCGPCVAETPSLKALRDKYRDSAVQFVGVSLDDPSDGGLRGLRKFVQKHQVDWPQFHGEKAVEFTRACGVVGVPTIFVVDRKGELHSIDGRGKLDTIIPELLR